MTLPAEHGRPAAPPVFASRAASSLHPPRRLRTLRLDRLFDPLAVEPHAREVVSAYRDAMARGEEFPPVAAIRLLGRWWVADGHKRLAAARQVLPADAEVPVEVWGFGRWSRDQLRQGRSELAKLARLPIVLLRQPRRGLALLLASPRHWWRVVRSLAAHARSVLRRRPRSAE